MKLDNKFDEKNTEIDNKFKEKMKKINNENELNKIEAELKKNEIDKN